MRERRTLVEEACSKRARSSGDRMIDSLPATAGGLAGPHSKRG